MNRRKLFIENMFSYGFFSVLNKIIPFLLLPIITTMIPNSSDFGIYSMYGTIIGFGTPFVMLGLNDAIFREYFEHEDQEYRSNILKTANVLIMLTSILVCLILIVFKNNFSILVFNDFRLSGIIVLSGFSILIGANLSMFQVPTRLFNQRTIFIVSSLLSSILMYGISLGLVYLGFSYIGLIYGNIITISVMIIYFFLRNMKHILTGKFKSELAVLLLKIGLPLLPTILIYWIFNSMDRIMIAKLLNTSELGVYSVGSKFAQISQFIYAGFAGGYGYFKYKTMNDDDQVSMNSKLYDVLSFISFLAFVVINPYFKVLYNIFFDSPYENGYSVVPYLFLCPLLLMLFQIVSTQFIIVRKSYISSLILTVGAITNIILNFHLIPIMGIKGAAIASFLGYFISVVTVVIYGVKKNLLILDNKTVMITVIMNVNLFLPGLFFQEKFLFSLGISLLSIFIIALIYKIEAKKLFVEIKQKGKQSNE